MLKIRKPKLTEKFDVTNFEHERVNTYWKSQNGRLTPVSEIDSNHIKNIINKYGDNMVSDENISAYKLLQKELDYRKIKIYHDKG